MLDIFRRTFFSSSRRRRPAKIVGLVPARNESPRMEFCLRALSRYTDAIVYLDDCSDDDTVAVVEGLAGECRVENIIRKERWFRDEPGDRNALLDAGRQIGGTHFIVIDADEAFSSNCMEGAVLRKQILGLRPGHQIAVHWIQLWRGAHQYRHDRSIWTGKLKKVIFCDDGVSRYQSDFIHTPRIPKMKTRKRHELDMGYGLLHFQFVNWRNLLLKQAWYRCLEKVRDPGKAVDQLNEKYGASKDESGLGVKPVPAEWLSGYHFFDPSVFEVPDSWREEQIGSWFEEHSAEFFSGLDIWDIDWSDPRIVSC